MEKSELWTVIVAFLFKKATFSPIEFEHPNSNWYIIKVWVSFHWLTDKTGTTVLEGYCRSQELNWT